MAAGLHIEIFPLEPERWPDLETLFGPRGATGGCWCMFWRLPHAEYEATKGETNRRYFRGIVEAGPPPGLLAYVDGEPAAWCALAPRSEYVALSRSRTLAPVDDVLVWSVPCFFVGRRFRRRGLTPLLLRAAAEYARSFGAVALEGYPVEPADSNAPPVFIFTGTAAAFLQAGFNEVTRRSPTRPIMRLDLTGEKDVTA